MHRALKKIRVYYGQKKYLKQSQTEVDYNFKTKVNTIFHHLTKEELIDKLLANQLAMPSKSIGKIEVIKKHKNN